MMLPVEKKRREVTCSYCRVKGHNIRGCQVRKNAELKVRVPNAVFLDLNDNSTDKNSVENKLSIEDNQPKTLPTVIPSILSDNKNVSKTKPKKSEIIIEKCLICSYRKPNMKTSCGHEFCTMCLKKWCKEFKCKTQSPTCPCCRSRFKENEILKFGCQIGKLWDFTPKGWKRYSWNRHSYYWVHETGMKSFIQPTEKNSNYLVRLFEILETAMTLELL